MSRSLATVSSCALLLFARHARAFQLQLALSSFHSTRVEPFESSASTRPAAAASWATAARPPRRRRQRSFGAMALSDPQDNRVDGDRGGGDSWLSEWKRGLVMASAALSIFGGGVLGTSPEGMLRVPPLPQDGGSSSVAMAAMAPSLMQDEKGYISIFEKVSYCVSRLSLK